MKSSMKKKFDFSAEMNEAESIKNTPKNEYWEEEKRLLDVNAKELASLNDNVHEMSINLVNFYTSFVIYSKSALYKIHIAFKEQIRNKTVFFYNSVFFSFHLISFFALGNI